MFYTCLVVYYRSSICGDYVSDRER